MLLELGQPRLLLSHWAWFGSLPLGQHSAALRSPRQSRLPRARPTHFDNCPTLDHREAGRRTLTYAARRLAVVVCALVVVLGGCRSAGPVPGTGDISFRLTWSGEADLDLHVTDPLDQHVGIIGAGNTPSPEEMEALRLRQLAERRGEPVPPIGELDVDCNAGPLRMCKRPIENVYWKPGTAPEGTYRAWVVLFRPPPDGAPVPFTLEVRLGETVVETVRGEVQGEYDASQKVSFVFRPS